jgi:anti-sigma-K factor RskA
VRDTGEAYLVDSSLPTLPDDQTYQLWAVAGKMAVSVGLLGPDPGVSAFKVAADGVTVLAVTAEQAGGVVSSTKTPVVHGSLPVV